MMHRIREAMKRSEVTGPLSGVIVADETFIGGKEQNRRAKDRIPRNHVQGSKTPV